MLGLLRRLVPGSSTAEDGDARFTVNRKESIARLLQLAERRQVVLDVQWPGESERYGTAILGVYAEHGFFVLDELNPDEGHAKLLERRELHASGRLEGVPLKLAARLIEARNKNGVAFYKMELPPELLYVQRRRSNRFAQTGSPLPFHARVKEQQEVKVVRGMVHDLSAEGVGVVFDGQVRLRCGDVLNLCQIQHPREGAIAFDLEIRHAAYLPDRQVTRTGGRMLNMEKTSLRRLRTLIHAMERELAKRKLGD
jgi:c-di-GMP-binding flagellar brake protein YcgR